MRASLSSLCIVLIGITAIAASAKPKQGCDVTLKLVHSTIEDHQLQPLQAYEGLFIMAFEPGFLRSRLGIRIRDAVAAKNQTASAYVESQFAESYAGEAVRAFDEFKKDKRLIAEFKTSKFVLIDSFETFVGTSPGGEPEEQRLALFRSILALRVREKRPSLVLFENLANVDRYLRGLLEEPKSEVSADKK